MDSLKQVVIRSSGFVDPLTAGLESDDEQNIGYIIDQPANLSKQDEEPSSSGILKKGYLASYKDPKDDFEQIFFSGQPYCDEWNNICKLSSISLENLISPGLTGQLRICRFRSICWFLFLKALPTDSSEWLPIYREKREYYEKLRQASIVTPGKYDENLDPLLNNPLSQDEQSPWNQYFEDTELKKLIRLDVTRTFPEVFFFQSQSIQDLMVTILFIYAKKYPKLSYVQGMHEILAPLLFVLHCDHQNHSHAKDLENTVPVLLEIMDETYLEHDSFHMFESVMSRLYQWYEEGEMTFKKPNIGVTITEAQPFARPQDIGPASFIVKKITAIHDNLLQTHEPDIYDHLNRLEIPPQVYGIRWARLMFGREFSITDLLLVWDSIFAIGGEDFALLEYIMVAMLTYVKYDLLGTDYISTLNLLMRYPTSADAQAIVRIALHYFNPKAHLRPARYSESSTQYSTRITTDTNKRISNTSKSFFNRSSSLPRSQVLPQLSLNNSKTKELKHRDRHKSEGSSYSSITSIADPINDNLEEDNKLEQQMKFIPKNGSSYQLQMNYSSSTDQHPLQDPLDYDLKAKPLLDCIAKLSSHKATLSTRHAEFNIENDSQITNAMTGIDEVINLLKEAAQNQ